MLKYLIFDYYDYSLSYNRYLILGIIPVVIVAISLGIEYLFIYKRLVKGQDEKKHPAILWWAIMGYYIFLLTVSAMLAAGDNPTETYDVHAASRRIMPLFYSYKEAYVYGSYAFENIILNICAFIPLGFLFPAGKKWFRRFWRTASIGFFFSTLIELAQRLFKQVPFDMDDLFNHTLGIVIGYGVYVLFEAIMRKIRKDKTVVCGKRSAVSLFVHQLPLFLIIAALSVIFVVHEKKELGDLAPYQSVLAFDHKDFAVSSEKEWKEESETLMVYKLVKSSETEAKAFADQFFKNIGTEVKSIEYNRDWPRMVYFHAAGKYMLDVSRYDGTYIFSDYTDIEYDYSYSAPESPDAVYPKRKDDAAEQEIRDALLRFHIQIPEGAEFSIVRIDGIAYYRFEVINMRADDDYIYDGYLQCDYYTDGRITHIYNNIVKYIPYKTFPAISEAKAYEQIRGGAFYWLNRLTGGLPRKIEVRNCKITYELDSKDFYQPVYQFDCRINTREDEIIIPCIQ